MEAQETIQTNDAKPFTMLKAMVGIGAFCGLLIVFTYELSKPRIETLKAEALQNAIGKVIPNMHTSVPFVWNEDNSFSELTGKTDRPVIYAGYNEGNELVGFAIEASGQGYADIIKILYGYDHQQQTIVGFYVLESKETPGLGDKIEKDDTFLSNFQALDVALNHDGTALENPVEVTKSGEKVTDWQIDGITGATISSRAIGDILLNSGNTLLPLLQKNLNTFKNTSTAQREEDLGHPVKSNRP